MLGHLFCALGLFNKEISSAPGLGFVAIKKVIKEEKDFILLCGKQPVYKNETVELLV